MSRPLSGSRGRPVSGKGPRNSRAGVSYEDLLVAQYLEELRRAPPKNGLPPSAAPFVHSVANTHIVPTTRPVSATAAFHRPPSGSKPKIDPKFIADHSMWDPMTPRTPSHHHPRSGRRRPISAPVYHRRPLSSTYGGGSRPTSAKSTAFGRRVKALYKKQQHVIVVTAYKNGSRDISARIAAPSVKMLLEMCTDRLGLGNAARRIFLEDGTEVFTPREIIRDMDVYISAGENFKDPYKDIKRYSAQQKSMAWTMNGLIWSMDSKKRPSRTQLSKRFRGLIEQSKRRVLVFKNGRGTEGSEIVADPERFEDFLQHCTAKLDLGTYARVLYDWEGNEINDLKEAPVLDQCLQTWSTPVMGPLWVSKGECFNPLGVMEFLDGLITYTKAKLKEARHYQKQLKYASDEQQRNEVEIVAILSMNEQEIEETLEIVAKDIEDFSNALNRLKEQMTKLKDTGVSEDQNAVEFTMNHIKEIKQDHRLIGVKGLRLKVYENGTYGIPTTVYFNMAQAARGGLDGKELMARLLDECSTNHRLANPKKNPNIKPVAQKLYDSVGHELKSLRDLEYDQEVWLSFGEPWKNPFSYVLTLTYDKVRIYQAAESGEGREPRANIREQLFTEDIPSTKYKASEYEVVEGIPEDHTNVEHITSIHEVSAMESVSGVDARCHFVRPKNNPGLLLYPDIVIDDDKKTAWPPDSQSFRFTQDGYIRCKCQPNLVMTVTDYSFTGHLSDPTLGQRETRAQGYIVGLRKKTIGAASQEWIFTPEGLIYCRSNPDMYLTYVGGKYGKEDTMVNNEAENTPKSVACYIAVCEKIEGKDVKAQRWAVKQDATDETGRFRYTQTENREWNKNAYSWPVTEKGDYDESFQWPIDGSLIPYAPSLTKSDKGKGSTQAAPLRLMAIKNGLRDITKAQAVVGPDLTNMRKDSHKHKKKHKNGRKVQAGETASVDLDAALHCDDDLSILKLEFILFLERCTSMLDLPFAARRLFDEKGQEHFNLHNLQRDQLVYVSCGEAWTDPKLTKGEQQRRYLLSNLASDVAQMRQYVSLRNPEKAKSLDSDGHRTQKIQQKSLTENIFFFKELPEATCESDLVLEVEGNLSPGSRIVISECALNSDNDADNMNGNVEETNPVPSSRASDERRHSNNLSNHEKAHRKSEEWLNQRKWPWERNSGGDGPLDPGDEDLYSNKELYHKFRPRNQRPANQSLQLQKFVYTDGFIACSYDQNLVLGIEQSEGRIAEVVLAKRRPDDVLQRWVLQANGIIQSKNNPNMVLSVSNPSAKSREEYGDLADMTYVGCQVTVKSRKNAQMGRANQRWYYDEGTGFIGAFYTSETDKEITAAIKANVCTFAVTGELLIDQPGFELDMPMGRGEKSKRIMVCSSCAHAIRGRYKLDALPGQVDFSCAMGRAKELGIKQIGSFKCLNGKVDLSTHEAQHTLDEWTGHLSSLRDELSVRTIAKEISVSRRPYTVKVLAYRNGEGRQKDGELIVGSSVPGILEQCTHRLGLTQLARRIYTADGTVVMDLDDLVTSAQAQYVEQARDDLKMQARARRASATGGDKVNGDSLISKVDLESSGQESEEEEPEQTSVPAGEDVHFGCDAAVRRGYKDTGDQVIIPNPDQPITHSGHVTAWRVYTNNNGQIMLMVMRPDPSEAYQYTLVSQLEFRSPGEGYYVIDTRRKVATKVSEDGQAMGSDIPVTISDLNIEVGDVIGFFCPNDGMVPYEYEEFEAPPCTKRMFFNSVDVGSALKMEPLEKKARNYSLNVTVTPMTKSTAKPSEKKKKKARMASKAGSDPPGSQDGQQKKKKEKHIDPPPVEMVLRFPIEVWVSAGEQFVKPEKARRNQERSQQERVERARVSYELDKEKHILRQMQGRRLDELNPGKYQSTMNPACPVLIEGHWQDPTVDEQVKHNAVHQLQTHLSEVKASHKTAKSGKTADLSKHLYTQPSTKRVLVFPNGESVTRAVYVWGETIAQLLDNSTTRLSLRKAGKILYDMDGQQVAEMSDLERDQLLCISATKGFLRPKESNQTVEMKANWGRARRKYGPEATDIMVETNKNPNIDVDAFGPSEIAGDSA